jgi:quinoprotein glucose dehydrogenase
MRSAFVPGLLVLFVAAHLGGNESDREWRTYGHDAHGTKYSPLDQIDASNVRKLRIAWRWMSPDGALVDRDPSLHPNLFEGTPIMLDGVLYVSTSLHQVAAIDAATGRTLWVYDPGVHESGSPPGMGFTHRGVSAWAEGRELRIFLATGDGYLIGLDAFSGEPIASFGEEGRIDLTLGLRRPVDRKYYGVNSPPLVTGDVVVVGSIITDAWPYQEGFPGDVRGFDARTGKLLWTFHTVPRKGEVGYDTWLEGSAERAGQANVWTLMSADEELGTIYLPLSTPTNDDYGGHRPGDNLFGESIVCVEARTGRRVWHFQAVHHGLWDYDLPAAPVLADIVVGGKAIKALAQVSKQAFLYVLDRTTGEPVWPIEERPVPASMVPGERASPTQPFPTRPAPFDRQGLSEDDLIDFTPALRAEARGIVSFFDSGPLFTPPTLKGLIVLPGRVGGASWAGAAYDPQTHVLYVPSVTRPYIVRLVEPKTGDAQYVSQVLPNQIGPQGLPLTKPPYGRITAIDLDSGEHLWRVPHGSGPRDHAALKDLNLPPLGSSSRGFVFLTKTLLFSAQGPHLAYTRAPRMNSFELFATTREPMLRAFDKKTGELLFEIELPANAGGAPMTYETGGRQFIVVPIGGGGIPAELVALALPSD